MDIEEKERLARLNDMGLEALAIRLRAARLTTGLSQKDLAEKAGVSNTVLNNAEQGVTAPNTLVMRYLYRAHRIDFNFLLNGNFSQLPADVQDRLFVQLEVATSEWDRRERSDRSPSRPKSARQKG